MRGTKKNGVKTSTSRTVTKTKTNVESGDKGVKKATQSNALKNKKEAARRLITTCELALLNTDYGLYTIRGVENLSHSDVENIIYYCNYFKTYGSLNGLEIPTGCLAEVLEKIKIYERSQDLESWNF